MKNKLPFFLAAFGLLISTNGMGQHLQRRAFLGVQVSPVSDSLAKAHKLKNTNGAYVARIVPNSTAQTLRLQPDDIILEINNATIKDHLEVVTMTRSFQPGQTVMLTLNRKGKTLKTKGKVQPMPFETAAANAEVRYDEVPLANNGYTRSIVKKPKGQGIFPTVFFIQGFSCSSVDNLPEKDTQRKLIDALVERGYAVYRMEKPGIGDHKNTKPCTEIGYQEELAAFASGLKQLKRYDFVDKDNIFLFGHSLGANTAPVIAAEDKVKGIITYGAAGKPWLEYLIKLFRDQRAITGSDYVEIDEDMKTFVPLLYEFMVLKKTPETLAKNPIYKKYLEEHFSYDSRDHLFGRHYTFLQQLHDVPGNKAWKDAAAHTLAIYGEADVQAIDAEGAKMIADVVNAYYPGKGTFEFLPRSDHGFVEVGTKQDYRKIMESNNAGAYAASHFNTKLVDLIDNWMKAKFARS